MDRVRSLRPASTEESMNRIAPALFAGLLLWPTSSARAEPIWGYRSPGNESIKSPGSDAGLTFPNTGFTTASGDQSVVATAVVAWSVAGADAPDAVAQAQYSFALELLDEASGQTGTVSFAGSLDGTIWKDGANLTNSFTGATNQSLDLGDYRYAVALDLFEAPIGFGEAAAGKITADVTITALDDPPAPVPPVVEDPEGPTAQTPEPATVVLGGLGLGLVTLGRRARAWARRHTRPDGD
jgi:hypothetical protein